MSFNDTVKLVFNHYSVKSWQNIYRAARPLFTKIEIINCFSIRVNTRSDLNKYQSGMYSNKPSNGNAERMCSFFFLISYIFFSKEKTSKKSAKDFNAVNVKIRGTRFRTVSRSDYEPNT